MKNGIRKDIDWELMGAILANEGDEEQSDFIKSFLKECASWGTAHQVEMQLCSVNHRLSAEERETLKMLSYDGEL